MSKRLDSVSTVHSVTTSAVLYSDQGKDHAVIKQTNKPVLKNEFTLFTLVFD